MLHGRNQKRFPNASDSSVVSIVPLCFVACRRALDARGSCPRGGTFDKVYLFGLTEYDRVVFFDADMLATGPGPP